MQYLVVDNLNDSGAGSLREALLTKGKRTITFAVGGHIDLDTAILNIPGDFTLDGSTAPEPIIIRKHGIVLQCANFTIQHITIDRGDTPFSSGENGDCLSISAGCSNGLVQFVTCRHALDGAIDLDGCHDITVRYCILTRTYRHSINDPEGGAGNGHSTGMFITKTCSDITLEYNLISDMFDRVPVTDGARNLKLIGNVIDNPGNTCPKFEQIVNPSGDYYADVIANTVKMGPSSNTSANSIPRHGVFVRDSHFKIYLHGNRSSKRPNDGLPDTAGMMTDTVPTIMSKPHFAYDVPLPTAEDAYALVLASAGAMLPYRTAEDKQTIRNVIDGTGAIIDSPEYLASAQRSMLPRLVKW